MFKINVLRMTYNLRLVPDVIMYTGRKHLNNKSMFFFTFYSDVSLTT